MAKDCIQCDERLRDKAKFCPNCGTAQPQEEDAPFTMPHAEALSERQAAQEEEKNDPSISQNKAEPLPNPNPVGEKAAPSIFPLGHKEEAKSSLSENISWIMEYLPKEIKRTHALAAIALLAVLALLFFTTGRVDRLIKQGDSYFDEEEYEAALEAYNKAIEIDPESAVAYTGRGKAYREQDDINRALADFNHAIDLDPEYAPAYRGRGILFHNEGQLDSALKDFNRAIDLDPKYVNAYINRGITYDDQKNYDQAIADYNEAIRLDPANSAAYNNRGLIYDDQGNYDQAIADYNEAIRLDPANSAAYNNRGLIYNDQENYDQAIADYSEAIRLDPTFAKAYFNRGVSYEYKGELNLAIQDYEKVLELNNDPITRYAQEKLDKYANGENTEEATATLVVTNQMVDSIGYDYDICTIDLRSASTGEVIPDPRGFLETFTFNDSVYIDVVPGKYDICVYTCQFDFFDCEYGLEVDDWTEWWADLEN